MARAILVIGESGAGKTTSLRTLDPATTLLIDADKKGESWRGWRRQYNTAAKNYVRTSDAKAIWHLLQRTGGDLKHIKVAVIDTLNAIMLDDEMRRARERGYDKWLDLATAIYGLISNIHDLRDDLTIVCMAHSQTDRTDDGYRYTHMRTSGKKLEKIVPESKFSTVLLAKGDNGKYVFETQANHSSAKSPLGLFEESEVPNDMQAVIEAIKQYEEEEDFPDDET